MEDLKDLDDLMQRAKDVQNNRKLKAEHEKKRS